MSKSTLTPERTDLPAVARPSERRRGVFGVLGIGLVAAIADMAASPQRAEAGLASPCCSLASNKKCSASCSGCSSCSNYHCPSGYHKEYWWCTAGNRIIGCGECVPTSSSTCGQGPFACSIWWDDGYCG